MSREKCSAHTENLVCVCMYKDWLKNSYHDVISAIDDFIDQWNPSTATLMEEVCRLHVKK